MGDRRNIVCEFEEASVAFYTHWRGSEAPADLRDALKVGQGRWSDPAYLARVIFCRMVMDDVTGDTGYGIEAIDLGSTSYCEASDRDLIVNLGRQTVKQYGDYPGGVRRWTYEEYVHLDDLALREI